MLISRIAESTIHRDAEKRFLDFRGGPEILTTLLCGTAALDGATSLKAVFPFSRALQHAHSGIQLPCALLRVRWSGCPLGETPWADNETSCLTPSVSCGRECTAVMSVTPFGGLILICELVTNAEVLCRDLKSCHR